MILRGCVFVDAVEIDGLHGVGFVHREVLRHAEDLAGAGVDHADPGRLTGAFFDEAEMRFGVEGGVAPRLLHAVNVADLAGDVEDDLGLSQCGGERGSVGDIFGDHADFGAERIEVVRVGAAASNLAIDHGDARAGPGKTHCEIAANESKATRDDDVAVLEPSSCKVRSRVWAADVIFLTHSGYAAQVDLENSGTNCQRANE